MTLYTLIDIDGNILQSTFTDNPNYPHSEDTRLLPDSCPVPIVDYDIFYYDAFRVVPVASDATEIQYDIVRKSNDVLRSHIISKRNSKIRAETWKYERIARHGRLGLAQVDDITVLDAYINGLCGIPQQQTFIDNDFENIDWPIYPDATPVVYFR